MKQRKFTLVLLLALFVVCVAFSASLGTNFHHPSPAKPVGISVSELRCEYRNDPQSIDVTRPRLSWVLEEGNQKPEARGQKQTAYQVLVASSEELLKMGKGDLWGSGKVMSDQSIAVRYDGKPLVSENRYWWKVRVDDKDGHQTSWSKTAN